MVVPELRIAMTAGRPAGRLSTEATLQHDSPPHAISSSTSQPQHHGGISSSSSSSNAVGTTTTTIADNNKKVVSNRGLVLPASSSTGIVDGRSIMMKTTRQGSRSATNLTLSPTIATTSNNNINNNNNIGSGGGGGNKINNSLMVTERESPMLRSASLKEVISTTSSSFPNMNSTGINQSSTTIPGNNNNNNNNNNNANNVVGPSIPFVRSRTGPQPGQTQSQSFHTQPPPQSQQQQQAQQQPQAQQQQYNQPQRERRDSHSVVSQASTGPGDAWQWQENNDPDDQEQALFEQRLCEDVYGVAVRKINHNGKSNLRYVKCGYYDSTELIENNSYWSSGQNSSTRSVSSRSRNGFSRFLLSGDNRSVDRIPLSGGGSATEPLRNSSSTNNLLASSGGSDSYYNNDAHHRTLLIPGKKIKALTWGKKKDVKIPVDRFIIVRKGKTTDRTRRNISPASRILSLITDDPQHSSLDIEAPTKLDRDKFARAFARFLNVPLEAENDMRSVRSDMTPPSNKDQRQPSSSRPLQQSNVHDPTANSPIPDLAMTTTNSNTTNASSRKHAPLPVVMTGPGPDSGGITGSKLPSKPSGTTTTTTRNYRLRNGGNNVSGGGGSGVSSYDANNPNTADQGSTPLNNNNNSFEVPDPQISSLPSSNNDTSMGLYQHAIGTSNTVGNTTNSLCPTPIQEQQPSKERIVEVPIQQQVAAMETPATNVGAATGTSVHVHTPIVGDGGDGGSVVSSITGAGFDQDLVEELHHALEKMRGELEESRAEAARAVKVAEQAIQSAEKSSSKDWNSTVTHKAAEAAAAAQKKSAEAMAKARMAEERLEIEKRNALVWKKQMEVAEEQAGHWQTRAAAAEVQRHQVAEALEGERRRNAQLLAGTATTTTTTAAKNVNTSSSGDGKKDIAYQSDPFDPFDSFRDLPPTPSAGENNNDDAAEIERLRSKLAMESARRRKLLEELQDLRGAVRVYCRPMKPTTTGTSSSSTITMASNEVLMIQRDGSSSTASSPRVMKSSSSASSASLPPLCFQFDGILPSDMDQHDVYGEFEAICASAVEGYKVCIMTYGQSSAGKSYTMLGTVEHRTDQTVAIVDHGIHLRSMQQLFSILDLRKDRYQDVVNMTLIEVHDERLIDLLARTEYGDERGKVEGSRKSSSRRTSEGVPGEESNNGNASQQANSITSKTKLEIKTNRDGETVVHGVLSVDVTSFDDVYRVWTESLAMRSKRLAEQDIDPRLYEMGSHVIATLKITSKNLVSGVSTVGRMQFVDFASSDIVVRQRSSTSTRKTLSNSTISRMSGSTSDPLIGDEWKFANKSLNTVSDVMKARSQYQRSVPYRNSTITHLISDSLEGDTKVVMIACVSADEKDIHQTTCTLRFANEVRKVVVGKATRHTSSSTTTNLAGTTTSATAPPMR